jgi:hypothetical protein
MNAALQKHLINRTTDLLKFCIVVGFVCYLITKIPAQSEQLVGLAGAFILGGSKLRDKIGV